MENFPINILPNLNLIIFMNLLAERMGIKEDEMIHLMAMVGVNLKIDVAGSLKYIYEQLEVGKNYKEIYEQNRIQDN